MGTWGYDAFSNDDSLDWLCQLEDSQKLDMIDRVLSRAIFLKNCSWWLFPLKNTRIFKELILFAVQAPIVYVAGEVVAALGGFPNPRLPQTTSSWVEVHKSVYRKKHAGRAYHATKFIRDQSETRILFDESGESEKWLAGVDHLLARLLELQKT